MKTITIEISIKNENFNGFTIKDGFVLFKDSNEIVGISSGWYDGGLMYIYTHQDGEWIGDWESEFDFPVEEALEMINEYDKQKEMEEMKKEVANLLENGGELHIAKKPIRFVDVVPGRLQNDGGEYGFYSTYYPTDTPGIYEYHTSTTCEIDPCGTGYEGLVTLTQGKYEHLVEEERRVLLESNF